MLQYVLIGLALGSIYAIASASLVVTYVSAGVLNFAFGSMAFVVARFYFWLNSQQHWGSDTAGAVSILVFAPLLGVVLYGLLFRYLRNRSTLVKLVATIGLSVAMPAVADLIWTNNAVDQAPGLAALGDKTVYHFFGAPITDNQLITYGFLVFVVVLGTAVLRFTGVGLRVRATVDSEAMASLSGANPGRVALGVWAVSATLAGLAGILVAPTNGLDTTGMTELMAAAFAAVVVARLRSLPGAVGVSLLMGVVTDVVQKYLPANSSFTAALIPSIPFGFIVVALVLYLIKAGSLQEGSTARGPLDEAIRPAAEDTEAAPVARPQGGRIGAGIGTIPVAVIALLPLVFHGSAYWLGLVAIGLCYGITFLTFTLVTGEGGMLWLSQIIFAGAGALATGQFATVYHLPVLLAVVLGGVIAGTAGAVIGLLTIRLGDLYVALVTLTFGLLVEQLVFTRGRFLQSGLGVAVGRPGFAKGDLAFAYLALVVFAVLAVLTINLRRSTSGLALRAVRDSEKASRTLGLSVVQVKVLVGAVAAFVAAVGGGFLAMDQNTAQPQSYATFLGLVWLAVVTTMGVRSITAALAAGMSFSLMPGLFASYVPTRWGEVPTVLFGLGAIGVARNPEGVIAQNGRLVRQLLASLATRWFPPAPPLAGALAGAAGQSDQPRPPGDPVLPAPGKPPAELAQ